MQAKKQKVTLTELQRYLPFPSPDGKFTLPEKIRRYLLSPSFGNFSFKQQNSMREKYDICYRNYFTVQMVVDHLDRLTNGKYYRHSLQMAVRNAAQKYQLIDWYKFYRTVKLNRLEISNQIKVDSAQQIQSSQKIITQLKQKAVHLIKKVFKKFLYRKKVKKGRQQVQDIKRTLEQRLILQFGKEVIKQVKQFYQNKNGQLKQKTNQFQNQLQNQKVTFIALQKLLNDIFEMYLEKKKIIYLYLQFDPQNKGHLKFSHFKQLVLDIKQQKKFIAETDYLSSIDKVMDSIRNDMKSAFYSASDMITQFAQKFLHKSSQSQNMPNKDDQIQFQPFYSFINSKGQNKYSRYQISKVLERVKFFANLQYLFNQPKNNQLFKALIKMTQKKKRKRQLHSQNQVFYSYKKILLYIVSRCKAQKLTKQGFSQFIVSHDPTLKYNSFFSVFRVYGNLINIKRIKAQSQLNPFACLLKTLKSQSQYEQLYQQFLQNYHQEFQLPYSSILDKINLRLDFLIENHNINPLPNMHPHDIVNYRKIITLLFQPDFDLVVRSYIHRKVASKFVALYRRIKYRNTATKNAMNLLSKSFLDQRKKSTKKKDTIESNDSKSRIGSKRMPTQTSVISCKTKKSGLSQKKCKPQDLQMVKDMLFDLIDKFTQDKNDSLRKRLNFKNDSKSDFVMKFKIVPAKKDKITFRSSFVNSFAYNELIGLVIFGNNNELMCFRNNKLDKIQIKLLYKPNISVLGLQIYSNFIVILTSYFTLEFYKLHQPSKYPFKTIKVGENITQKLSNNEIQRLTKDGQYGAYPKLLKSLSGQILGINMSFIDQSIWIMRKNNSKRKQTQKELFPVKISKRQHYFNKSIEDLIRIMGKRSQKRTIQEKIRYINQVVDFLASLKQQVIIQNSNEDQKNDNEEDKTKQKNQNEALSKLQLNQKNQNQVQSKQQSISPSKSQKSSPLKVTPLNLFNFTKNQTISEQKKDMSTIATTNYKKFLQIIQTKEQNQEGKRILSQYQWLQIFKFFLFQTQKQFFRVQLREQLVENAKQHFKIKVPEEIREITLTVQEYLSEINFSLKDLIQKLDEQKQGCIKVKKIKDYFLKITQQTYLIHEKRIDSYLKKLAISKHISYDSFVSIFTEWNFKIWEKPRQVVRDFLVVQKFSLLIYTLDNDHRIFIRTLQRRSRILAELQGHQSVPCISLAQSQMILISGDSSKVKGSTVNMNLWRLNEDVITKICTQKVLKVKPFYTIKSVHDDGISSITYLSRAYCLVTASLDSTMKIHLIHANPFNLQEIQRIYFHDCYFLALMTKKLEIQRDILIESLVSLRIKKHINQKNVNKYQITCEVYSVEKVAVKIPVQNEFLSLPIKLTSLMEIHASACLKKKEKHQARKVQKQMQNFISIDYLEQSLEANFFSALKKHFIFNEPYGLINLLRYVEKKQDSVMIMENIFLKYGLKIVDKNLFPIDISENSMIEFEQFQSDNQNLSQIERELQKGSQKIFVLQQDLIQIQKALNNLSNKVTGMISIEKLKQIAEIYLFGKQLEKFWIVLQFQVKKQKLANQEKQIISSKMNTFLSIKNDSKLMSSSVISKNQLPAKIVQLDPKNIIKYFSIREIKNNVQKFYKYLRQVVILLKKKKTPIWRFFSTFQQNISKEKYILANNFMNQLKSINFPEDKAQLISWYLSDNGKISIFELINYVQIAFKHQKSQDNGSYNINFSKLLNSSIIQNEQKNLENIDQYNSSKLKQKIDNKSKINQSIRASSRFKKLSSDRNGSEIYERKSQDSSVRSSKKESRKVSNIDRQSQQRSQSGSRRLSPSNSLGTLTRQISYSNTKDSKKREVYEIRHKLNNLLTNQRKTLWQLVSSAIPQFLQEAVITETQYFDLFKLMKSTLKLSEKLALLNYLKNQHPQRVIDLNDLFQLLQDSNKNYAHGEKYIIQYFVNKLISGDENLTIEQALQLYFFQESEDQLSIQQFIEKCCHEPFKFNHFALRQFEDLLYRESKSGFIKQDIIDLIDKISQKYELKIQNKNLTIMEEILFKIDKRKVLFQEIFPKVDMVTETYFVSCINNLSLNYSKKSIVKDFETIKLNYKKTLRKKTQNPLTSNTKRTNKSTVSKILQIPYAKFKTQLTNILQQTRESTDKERESSRKLVRYLHSKRVSVFNFFISLDLQKKFFINQIQFQTGLTEIGIGHSFWHAIDKKFQNRLYYYEFIRYLVDSNVLDIKYVDSELEIAMQKLIKRVIRNTDLQEFYQKLIDHDQKSSVKHVTFKSFNHFFVQNYSVFSQKQIAYLFSTFVNSQHIKNSKFSNDQVIKNQQNIEKTFNFQMFVDVVHLYKMQTLTKTPQFKFIDYLKKRNISLLHEFYKFMQKNKKNKEIAQVLKKKTTVLSKQLILNFLNQIKAGLSEKEIKQILSSYTQAHVDFTVINQKLQQTYKKASIHIEKQQAEVYLGEIYKKSKQQNVAIQRLFSDFCQQKNNKLTLKDFMNMSDFLNTGLNKIQLKKIFTNLLDQQNKGFCFLSQMMNAIQNVEEKIDKDDDDFQFDFLLQKIENNRKDINLRESQMTFSLQKCISVFSKVLTKSQVTQLYTRATQNLKKQKQLTQKDVYNFIEQKNNEKRMKADKKYKELVLTLLNTIKKSNIDITQVYKYFTMGSKNTQVLPKDRFLLLYQSVVLKSNIIDVNNLYTYFDENKIGNVSLQKWEQKLGIIDMENQNIHGSVDQLKVFYKVKLFLAELYLAFVQKQFKTSQIYHYFDKNANGVLKYHEFWSMIYELGFEPSDELQKKVVNYLDRTKSKVIEIRILMTELQNCLGKKQKTILETKTSFIFKKNAQIIQSKYSYFINELIKRQQLVQKVFQDNQVHQQSCIMESDFLNILKRFGIYLTDQQLNDLRRNFQSKQNYLYLYPIYFMLKNIFEETSSFQEKQKSQKVLFKKLLTEMIRNKITLRQIEQIKSHQQMKAFMKQLKIFTPIEIEIILDNISYEQSSVINSEKLKVKIRDSYVDMPVLNENILLSKTNFAQSFNAQESLNVIAEDDYLNQTLRDHLRSLLKFQNHISLLEKYPKNIYQQDFREILQKLGCKIKVKDMKKYFKAFSMNKRFIKTQNLIFQNNFKSTKINHQIQEQTNEDINQLFEHIEKSLHYTNRNFRKAVEKYFVENYGFITVENFRMFLKQIGYEEGQRQNKVIQKFIAFYEKNYALLQEGKKCKQLQVVKLEDILSTEETQSEKDKQDQIENNNIRVLAINQSIISPQVKKIIFELKKHNLKLIEFLKNNDILESFSVEVLYKFITDELLPQQISVKQRNSYEKAARIFCIQLNKKELTLDELQIKLNHMIKFHYMHSQTQQQNKLLQQNDRQESILQNVLKSNIVSIFNHQANRFVQNVSKTYIGGQNIDRVSLNLLFQQIETLQHLLIIGSKFQKVYQRQNSQKLQIYSKFDQITVSLLTSIDLIIETQRYLQEKALTVINQKYYAISVNRRDEFQAFAKIASHLNPSSKFIRAKGYYLWQPNTQILPKCSIRYRWKFVKNFAFNLLTQFDKIHKLGYCCPHLRYEDLNQNINKIVDKAIYPWKVDSTGKVIQAVHSELFDIECPYSVPQIIRNQKGLITSKCDSWIFGCLLYEFIWGHQPLSFFTQLLGFNKARNMGQDLDDVIDITQYPCQFAYKFYNTQKILKLYQQEFYFGNINAHRDLETNIKKWQSFKGLTYPLQIVFGKDLIFYQDQFNILAQIHQIIYQCLDPNPFTRPSIEEVLKRPLFNKVDNFDLKPYIQTINQHVDTSQYEHQIFSTFEQISQQLTQEQNQFSVQDLDKFIQKVTEFLNETQDLQSRIQKVDKIFTIPKHFPWPVKNHQQVSQSQSPYSYNLSKHKDEILKNPLLNTLCRIFKKRMIPKVIQLFKKVSDYLDSGYKQPKVSEVKLLERCQVKIQNLLLTVLELTKRYDCAACGFVDEIIGYVMFYISGNAKLNLKIEDKENEYSVLGQQSGEFKIQQPTQQSIDYFKVCSMDMQKLSFIKKMENVIFINGEGNAQYEVLRDYLSQNERYRTIMEIFYSSIQLMTLTNKCNMAISYFRDRVYLNEEMPNLMKQLRIELLVLRNIHQKSLKESCLSFFLQLIENSIFLPKLFYCHLFYMQMTVMLRNPLETVQIKGIVIDILVKLMEREEQQIIETMTASSCNVFPVIVRSLIQPAPQLAVHDQFQRLKDKLSALVNAIETSFISRQLFQQVQGGLYALKHFKNQQYLGQSYKNIE